MYYFHLYSCGIRTKWPSGRRTPLYTKVDQNIDPVVINVLPCFGLNAFRFWLEESDFVSAEVWINFGPLFRFEPSLLIDFVSLENDKLALPAFILAVISSSFDNIRSLSVTLVETRGSNSLVDTKTLALGVSGLILPLGGALGLRPGFESVLYSRT